MRLSTEEITGIIQALNPHITEPSTLYLYGSRVDDQRRGGDIDLLILTSKNEREVLMKKKHILLCDIKEKIGEQRIDLTIANQEDADKEPFLKIILEEAVVLSELPS